MKENCYPMVSLTSIFYVSGTKKQAFCEIRCSDGKNIRQYKKIEENRCSDVKTYVSTRQK